MKRRSVIAIAATLTLAAGYLAISPALKAKGDLRANSERASVLLSEARSQALALQKDVNLLMVSYAQTHVPLDDAAIAEISQHIADMEGLTSRLDNAAEGADVWQREVIAQVTPILKELAGNTNSALGFLNNPDIGLHESEFEEYITESDNLAKEAAAHVASDVDYGTTKNRFYDSLGRLLNALMAGLG